MGPSATLSGRLFFIMGIIKSPECFPWLMSYARCKRGSNISARRTAMIVKKLNPKSAPSNETLLASFEFSSASNLEGRKASFHTKCISKFKQHTPRQKAPAGGMGHAATCFSQLPKPVRGPRHTIRFVKLSSACLSSKRPGHYTPGVSVLCLDPALFCTSEFQLLTQSNECRLFALRKESHTWQASQVHT